MNDDRYDRRGGSRPGPDARWQRRPGPAPGPGPQPPRPPSATVGREPDLITHQQPLLAGPPDGYRDRSYPGAGALSSAERRTTPRKKIWRRVRRTCYVLAGVGILGPIVAFFIVYQFVKVPRPEDVLSQANQVGVINYANGTEMTKILPTGNHSLVQYKNMPEHVRQAVYAAEDRTFLQNRGFDFQGIARAVWKGGGGGGGSTISQQYVKNASNNWQPTLSRKFVELVTAAKMSKSSSKQDIITAYLNIIYFGRGATGISDAAQAYFGKPLDQLTISEGAMLAGVIQSPSNWDPSVNLPAATARWNYVLDGMVTMGTLDKATRDAQQFPHFLPRAQGTALLKATLNGPRRYIQEQVIAELEAQNPPITQKDINQRGLKITTTIDPKAQQAAEAAYQDVMVNTKQPDPLRGALVAVDPKTGGVLAYEGGGDGTGTDWASALNQPGSSFKPFVLTAYLKQGGYLYDNFDGSSPRTFPNSGRAAPVANSGGTSINPISVKDAMTKSLNTVFYDMGLKVGTPAVQKSAYEAGIPQFANNTPLLVGYNGTKLDPNLPPDGNISIGGGYTQVRPLDMAYAYATFANNGTKYGSAAHFVSTVVDSQGKVVYQPQAQPTQAFDANPTKNADIARNVTESMTSVASTSYIPLGGGRPVATKTGTEQSTKDPNGNRDAWTAGYTPSVAAAAWVGTGDDMAIKGNYPCQNCGGAGHDIYGRMEPGVMWQKFMDGYLNGTPPEQFSHLQLLNAPVRPSTSQEAPPAAPQTDNTPVPTTTQPPVETPTTKPSHPTPVFPTPSCSFLTPCDTGAPTPTLPTTTPGHGRGGGGSPPPTTPTGGG